MVKKYIDLNPGTVFISVSDHETGGFSVGRQNTNSPPKYAWNPDVIARVKNSTSAIAKQILKQNTDKKKYVSEVALPKLLGISDFSKDDVTFLSEKLKEEELVWYMGELVNRRALLGWTTHGHTGVDVNLYGYAGQNGKYLLDSIRGNVENTNLASFVQKILGIPEAIMDSISQKLIKGVKDGTLILRPRQRQLIVEKNEYGH
jgi:alkaline phosphatase